MSKVAQRYGVNANLLFTWRRQQGRTNAVGGQEPIELLPVTIADAGSAASPVAAVSPARVSVEAVPCIDREQAVAAEQRFGDKPN